MLQKSTGQHRLVPLGAWVLTQVLTRVLTRVAAGCSWAFLGAVVHCWTPLGAAGHICANFATCNWEPQTIIIPHFVAGEHGLFGGHKSEDIRTFFFGSETSNVRTKY